MTDNPDARSRPALYGRRKGKPLRAAQAARFDTLLPRLKIDLSRPAALAELFDVPGHGFRLGHVSWLRRKLGDDANNPRYISTVRGMGFRFESPGG